MGYNYLWNQEGTDGTLVGANGADHALNIQDPAAPGGKRQITWRVPGRQECMFCHSRAANFVLGLNPSQMNRDHDYGAVEDNQIRTLDHIGLFKTRLTGSPEALPRFVNPYDEKADLNERARTYLHVNCSICHVSDGGGNSYIELDKGRKLEDMKAVGGKPVQGTFGITDAMIIAPGEPERSVLFYRMASLGGSRMPRVGSRAVDEEGLELIHDWIKGMPAGSSRPDRAEIAARIRTLRHGKDSSSPSCSEAIRRLTSSTSGSIALAHELGRGALPPHVRREIIEMTGDHPRTEVRDLFERFVPESQRIRRLGDTIDPAEILALKGDARRGRALFAAESVVNCKSCHRLAGIGEEVGPDLGKIGTKYPRPELLRQILEPSRSVDPRYTVYRLDTRSGHVHSGLLVERNEREVVLRDAQNKPIRVAVGDIEELTPQKQSLMPDLLLRGLTAQQAADLLEYLASLR
jgi:putative heme-binding domain-containing protein